MSPAGAFAQAGVFRDPATDRDVYGDGERLHAFEARIASLLGKPAAVFMPSGTMAQQIALRIVADRTGVRTFAAHPTNHLTLHERDGYARLHGLAFVPACPPERALERADLEAIAEPVATVLLELPQREIGGVLPQWDELAAMTGVARERGWAVHCDGARLWECAPFYDRSYAEIAALFDTVYVSFYKGIGALAGSMLCGPKAFVDEARVWQRRHGGNLFTLYPYANTAEAASDLRIGRMAAYHDAAAWLAPLVASYPAVVRAAPLAPPTNMFHAYVDDKRGTLGERAQDVARDLGVWTFNRLAATAIPGVVRWEFAAGDATIACGEERARAALDRLFGD